MKNRGFTLVELAVVLVIVSVLAAFTLPALAQHWQRARRASARAAIEEAALHLHLRYTLRDRYDAAIDDTGSTDLPERLRTAPPRQGPADTSRATHTLRLRTLEPTRFVVEAQPLTPDARCGTLSLDQLGRRGATGTAGVDECWR